MPSDQTPPNIERLIKVFDKTAGSYGCGDASKNIENSRK